MITTTTYFKAPGEAVFLLLDQDTGAATKKTLDNSLNSGLLQVSKSTRELPYERFGGIRVIYETTGKPQKIEDYRILGDVVTLEAKGSAKRYQHEIQTIEPTKWHERIIVGSKSFSRNKDGSAKYTLYDVIVVLRDIARFEREDVFIAAEDLYTIPASVETILKRYDAPQLFFKEATLRECINGTLAYIDAIYELDIDNNIILRFFNDRTGEVAEVGDFDDTMRITNSDYYSTEMDIVVQNMVNDKVILPLLTPTGINRHTINNFANLQNSQNPLPSVRNLLGTFGQVASTTGGDLPNEAGLNYGDAYECVNPLGYTSIEAGITFALGEFAVINANGIWKKVTSPFGIGSSVGSFFRSEDVVLGDVNQLITLNENLKIYEVEDVYIGVRSESVNEVRTALCTEFFVTQAEYAKLLNAETILGFPTLDENTNRQNTVRYAIGGSQIEGFGDEWGPFGLARTIDNMIRSITKRSSDNLGGTGGPIGLQLDPFANEQILFTFIYRPIVPKMRIKVARTWVEDINVASSIRENQDENIVSMQNYGSNLLAKANRFGNETLIHTETVIDIDDLKDRGYTIPGTKHILTEVEKTSWTEFIKAKYTFTKFFNRFSEFIGLAGRRRQYELLPEDTVDRLLNYTEYLQVIPGDVVYENETVFSDFAIDRIIESLMFAYGDNTIRGVIITSDDINIDASELFNNTGVFLPVWIESTLAYWSSQPPVNRDSIVGDLPDPTGLPDGYALKQEDPISEFTYWQIEYQADPLEAGIYLPVFKTGAAKSLIFSLSFKDTLNADDRIQEELVDSTILPDELLQSKIAVSYVDDNSELRKMRIKFVNYLNPDWKNISNGLVDFDKYRGDAKNAPATILNNRNLGGNHIAYTNGEYRVEKDLAERLSFTQQLQLLGYKDEIIIGNEWARLNNLIIDLPGPNLYLYIDGQQYDLLEDKKIKSTSVQLGLIEDYADITGKQIVLNAAGISATRFFKSWAIGDSTNNLWIAVNQSGEFGENVSVLSFKGYNKRPELVYNI